MRVFVGIVVGIMVALAVQAGVDLITNQLYPAAISDIWDRRQISEAFAARPTGALLLSVLGFFLGGFTGALAAKRVSRAGWTVWVPSGVLALMALVITFNFPLPAWTWFAALAAPLIGGLLARHVGGEVDAAEEAGGDAAV